MTTTPTTTTNGLTGDKARRLRNTARDAKERCWQYDRIGCKNKATDSVRLGNRVYHFCDEHPAPGVAR